MIVDTSALLAFFDTDEPDHEAVTDTICSTGELLVVSPYVVAEAQATEVVRRYRDQSIGVGR